MNQRGDAMNHNEQVKNLIKSHWLCSLLQFSGFALIAAGLYLEAFVSVSVPGFFVVAASICMGEQNYS
jgi:hypothetical protein